MPKSLMIRLIALFVIASQLGFASTSVLAAVKIPPLTISTQLGNADTAVPQDNLTKKDKVSKNRAKPAAPFNDNQANQTTQ